MSRRTGSTLLVSTRGREAQPRGLLEKPQAWGQVPGSSRPQCSGRGALELPGGLGVCPQAECEFLPRVRDSQSPHPGAAGLGGRKAREGFGQGRLFLQRPGGRQGEIQEAGNACCPRGTQRVGGPCSSRFLKIINLLIPLSPGGLRNLVFMTHVSLPPPLVPL